MKKLGLLAALILGCILTAGSAEAQVMTVPPGPLVPGSNATITYSDPSQTAGTTITIEVSGGFPFQVEKVDIVLDANGEGQGTWLVNGNWFGAAFNAPGVKEIARAIS